MHDIEGVAPIWREPPTHRNCLCCREPFKIDDKHKRVCPFCQRVLAAEVEQKWNDGSFKKAKEWVDPSPGRMW